MTEKTTDIPTNITDRTTLAERAKIYALQLFNEKGDARLTYHNFPLTVQIHAAVKEIAAAENAAASVATAAEIAAWFCNTGYLSDPANPVIFTGKYAEEFLTAQGQSPVVTERVIACLQTLEADTAPRNEAAKIFSDAVTGVTFAENFSEKSALLRLESELLMQQQFSKADWTQFRLRQIITAKYYTAFAKEKYEIDTGRNLLTQKNLVEKSRNNTRLRDEESPMRLYQDLERKNPERATQTFFRANYRNHINLSQIADNKANIMISVNAILISVVLSIVSYQNITERNPIILAPVVIFVVAGLASLVCAVLSARPKVTSLNKGKKTKEEIQKNVAYFGNFTSLSLPQFEEAMDAVMRDGELMYGNMTRDLYYLGKVLDKKYRLLTVSYNIFMVGFVAAAVMFLVAVVV